MKAMLFNDTSVEKHIGCTTVIQNIKKLCEERGLKLIKSFNRKAIFAKPKVVEKTIREADIIVINGEGSLHHTPQWFVALLETIPKDKKTFLINTVWEKMFLEDISILNKLNLISVRESESYNQLIKAYPEKDKILCVPDLPFYVDKTTENVGYGDSVIDGLKNFLSEKENYFPLQFHAKCPTVEAYINWLKTLKLYITGRFHGVCLSAIAETPFLAFPSNSHKIEGLLRDMKCEELLINSLNEVEKAKKNLEKYQPYIKKYTKTAKQKIVKLFDRIAKEAKES